VKRFLRFAAVGLSGVVVDMGIFFLLSDHHGLGWGLTRSKLVASEAAIVNNFLWNDVWTFQDVARSQASASAKLGRFAKFQAICLAGIAISIALLNFQFNVLGINRYIANGVAIGAVTVWNFWLNLKFGWRVTAPAVAPTLPLAALTRAKEPSDS
jgi:dolichol-phosphate mannosyltransferase